MTSGTDSGAGGSTGESANTSSSDRVSPASPANPGNPSASARAAGSGPSKYRGAAYRSNRRRDHHDDAHSTEPDSAGADSPSGQAGGLPDHLRSLITRGGPLLIERQADLLALLDRLRAAGSFAYDSEFIGESTYTPKLCLVQIATTTEVALVDPLSPDIDLTPFWALLCDESVEKIVHAGQQDVEPVVRLTGDRPRGIFDTQIAAGFVSLTYPVALSKLCLELLGARLAKSMTFTQWDARPLSATQLKYAADDVRYLPALRAALGERLEAAGHTAKATEEFDALCEPTQYRFDPNTYIFRVRGSGSLTPGQMRVLRELVIWRDGAAREADVPMRSYLKDEILVDLCRSPAKTADKLGKVRGLPRPVEIEHGQAIVAATLRGLSAPPVPGVEQEKADEPAPSLKFRADALWTAAQAICHAVGIDPMMGTSRQEIGRLTYAMAAGKPTPDDLRLLAGWRKTLLGDRLTKVLAEGGDARELLTRGLA